MSATGPGDDVSETVMSSQLVLDIWHPDCWTLEATAGADGGLIAHGVYLVEEQVNARIIAYGDTNNDVDALVARIEASEHTESVQEITQSFGPRTPSITPGNTATHLLVSYAERKSIHEELVTRGFVPSEAIRIHDGREYWTVVARGSRSELRSRIYEVEDVMDADIKIKSTGPSRLKDWNRFLIDDLSERQREVLQLARQRGYYQWPRETSASDLADELNVSKTTFLEHLRKAESKVMGQR